MFDLEVQRADGWHLVVPQCPSLPAAVSEACAVDRGPRRAAPVRVMAEENGVRVQLRFWGAGTSVLTADGPEVPRGALPGVAGR